MKILNEHFTQNIIFLKKKSYIILLKLLTLITFVHILITFKHLKFIFLII